MDAQFTSEATPQADAANGVLRVLIAKDCDDVRDMMRRMVEKLGHIVDEAADGQEAVEAQLGRVSEVMPARA